ncbi:MAG TPA: hypothetical protein VMX54_13720 [Vicinamibacteria bacterium]|nr:hypothetical protein [Vicinamibacteria bacterium]
MRLALRLPGRAAVPILVVGTVFLASGAAPARGAAAGADATEGGAASPSDYAIHIAHPATAGMLRLVLDGARRRLATSRCQEVLDEFSGPDGRSLRLRLEELHQTPEGYLRLVVFYDGRTQPRCAGGGVLAVTQVDSRVVYVCPEQLRRWARHDPRWVEATLIHEALHTLGLGENPPSSQEITFAVIRKCGR